MSERQLDRHRQTDRHTNTYICTCEQAVRIISTNMICGQTLKCANMTYSFPVLESVTSAIALICFFPMCSLPAASVSLGNLMILDATRQLTHTLLRPQKGQGSYFKLSQKRSEPRLGSTRQGRLGVVVTATSENKCPFTKWYVLIGNTTYGCMHDGTHTHTHAHRRVWGLVRYSILE